MTQEYNVICYTDSSVNQWEIYKKVSDWIRDRNHIIIENIIVYYNGDDGDYYSKIYYIEI